MCSTNRMTDKQAKFCEEYILDFNGQAAAERAGYAKSSARAAASRMLTKDNIQARIKELTEKATEANEIKLASILQELKCIAFSDIRNYAEIERRPIIVNGKKVEVPKLKISNPKDLPAEYTAAIQQITDGKHGLSIKLYDKLDAIEKLMRYVGAYEKDNEQTRPNFERVEFKVIGSRKTDK